MLLYLFSNLKNNLKTSIAQYGTPKPNKTRYIAEIETNIEITIAPIPIIMAIKNPILILVFMFAFEFVISFPSRYINWGFLISNKIELQIEPITIKQTAIAISIAPKYDKKPAKAKTKQLIKIDGIETIT